MLHAKQKLHKKRREAYRRSSMRMLVREVNFTDNFMEFDRACEELQFRSLSVNTLHRSETNGSAERGVQRVKEGNSAILPQSGLDEKCGLIPWNIAVICATFKTSFFLIGKLQMNGDSENNYAGQSCLIDR